MRDEVLNEEIRYTLREAPILVESWRRHYNAVRLHSSIGQKAPVELANQPSGTQLLDEPPVALSSVETPAAPVTRLSHLPRGGLRLIHQLLNCQAERIQVEINALLFGFAIDPNAHCVQVYVYRSHFYMFRHPILLEGPRRGVGFMIRARHAMRESGDFAIESVLEG